MKIMSSSDKLNLRERSKALHEQFLTLVWIAFRRMVQRLQGYGLTHPQFITLAALVRHSKPASMGQLTAVTLQDAPTMTGIVNRLVKMGLVRRARSEDDRRIVWVESTPEGMALVEVIEQDMEQDDLNGFCSMTDEEITKIEEALDRVLTLQFEAIHPSDIPDIETARHWFIDFAHDPIGFVKERDVRST
jgi:DNA-binding MarR family transcriptional regulator